MTSESTTFACETRRLGVVMAPDLSDPNEELGVLNPGVARFDGETYLLARLVAAGNESRVGLARVQFDDLGGPVSVQRGPTVLEPDETWERNAVTGGVEDPRVTFIPELSSFLMTYCAYGPLGPRTALAISSNLRDWRRLGPVTFGYDPEVGGDLNLYSNKDAVIFPTPVPGPDGRPAWAMLHRPNWDLGVATPAEGMVVPTSVTEPRPSIWVSYAPVAPDPTADFPTHFHAHRPVAGPEFEWETVKIGAGPPPVAVPGGWLLVYHGVSGQLTHQWPEKDVIYAAGAMLLDPADVTRVLWRSAAPILDPATDDERDGIVPNVVFPTGLDVREPGKGHLYYGMADSRIGAAEISWTPASSPNGA